MDKSLDKQQYIDTNIFVAQDMLEEVTCPICQNVLNHPAILPCTHKFCQTCIELSLRSHNTCPSCRAPTHQTDLKPDLSTWKIVCSYKVRCNRSGCDWIGKFEDLLSHQTKYCGSLPTICEFGCGKTLPCCSMAKHKLECPAAEIVCFQCQTKLRRVQADLHLQTCPSAIFECEAGCGARVVWAQRQEHYGLACRLANVQCKYHIAGCRAVCPREKLAQHYKDAADEHLELMFTAMNSGFDSRVQRIENYLKQKEAETLAANESLTAMLISLGERVDKLETEVPKRINDISSKIEAENAEWTQQIRQKANELRSFFAGKVEEKASSLATRLCRIEVMAKEYKEGKVGARKERSSHTGADGQRRDTKPIVLPELKTEEEPGDKCIIQ